MECPNCGTLEQGRARICPKCGTAYASEDLLALYQLEFLLAETAGWPEVEARRKSYFDRLVALRARILPGPPEPDSAPQTAEPARQPAAPARETKAAPTRARPVAEAVPFDQWLLSERNIKIALYTGGALLVLAGLIFVGVNWARLPGPAKFAITLMITGLMYLGGYLLSQRPTLKLGGVALLGVASGFLPLNFVVLQIYIFAARGLSADVMWFIGSLPTLLLYLLTAYWTRADLFTYLSLGAVGSALTAGLVLLDVPPTAFAVAYALTVLVLLIGARALQSTRLADFTRTPLLVVSHVAMPILLLASAYLWQANSGCVVCSQGSPWLALTAMLVGVGFYVAADLALRWLVARWIATFSFAVTLVFLLSELRFSGTATGICLMVLALAYLLVGRLLEPRLKARAAAWPLYAAGYTVAAFVTLEALLSFGEDPDDLAKILIADVVLLGVSAWVHRQYAWVYGATWVFILPVFIYASLYLQGLSNRGLVLGVLILNYAAAGYALGRRALSLGGPFLTAACGLSPVVVALTWATAPVSSIVLVSIAVLYLLVALWRNWAWLLFPALASVDLAVVAILRIFFDANSPWTQALTIIYAGLGVVLTLGGVWLRQTGQKTWGWPLCVVAVLNLAGSYFSGLSVGGPMAIALSGVNALLAFGLAWVERETLARAKLPPLLTYIGIGVVFIGHFSVIGLSDPARSTWPPYTAGLCALFVALAWLLRRDPIKGLYATPLRWAGLGLMIVPMVGAIAVLDARLAAIAFAVAGTICATDAAVRRILRLGYLAGGAYIAVTWAVLIILEVGEPQAYVLPLGLALLVLGWNERRLGGKGSYRWPTLLGLILLLGSAFFESVGAVVYAVLLLGESLAAIAWGVWTHSRGYVQLGVLSLVANAVAQLGPGFVDLPRWIQLAAIGSILLGGGLVALFRRDQLLATRKRLGEEWRQWQP